MRIVVLLSAGISPVSGRPAPVPSELRAIGLATQLVAAHGGSCIGLHVGTCSPALREYAGYGLDGITCVEGAGNAVVEAIATQLSAGNSFPDGPADLVLTGRRGMGGEDSGMLPYLLAERLGWPVVGDVITVQLENGSCLAVEQGRPRGVRRPVSFTGPGVLTIHESAPALPRFIYARARATPIRSVPVSDYSLSEGALHEERPYRARPKMISAAGTSRGGETLIAPSPEEAAREILVHLRALGVLKS